MQLPILLLFLVFWLALILLPFAMRSWRSFLALCAAYVLIGAGVRLGVATLSASQVPAFLVMLGNFWLEFVVDPLPVPVIARAVVLAAKTLGLGGKRLVALNVIGVLALPGIWLGHGAYRQWDRRPAPVDCTARPLSLTLSGSDGVVPWSQAISLYLGPDLPEDARYLFSPADSRSICRDTRDGTERLNIKALSIRIERTLPDRCNASDIQSWEKTVCAAAQDAGSDTLPRDVVFFDPEGIRPGYFGIPDAATNEGYPLTEDRRLVSVESPKSGRVTAVCRKQPYSDGSTNCQMRRQIRDGLGLYWEISLPQDTVGDGLVQADAFARSICSSVFDLPECGAGLETPP